MTLLHVTDPHFEFLPRAQVVAFGATCRALAEAEGAEVVVMTGDVSTAARCDADMGAFLDGLGDGVVVAAVRGNHDYYVCARQVVDGDVRHLRDAHRVGAHPGTAGWASRARRVRATSDAPRRRRGVRAAVRGIRGGVMVNRSA